MYCSGISQTEGSLKETCRWSIDLSHSCRFAFGNALRNPRRRLYSLGLKVSVGWLQPALLDDLYANLCGFHRYLIKFVHFFFLR